MALLKQQKEQIVKKHKRSELDTGSCEVQVGLLTARILELTEHFKKHKFDHHGKQGLTRMVNRRRRLLDYLKGKDVSRYKKIVSDLQLRK